MRLELRRHVRHRVWIFPALVLLLVTTACPQPESSRSASDDTALEPQALTLAEAEVIAAHRNLVAAFEQGDLETVVSLLDHSNQLPIFHPYLRNRFDGAEEIRRGLGQMFDRLGPNEWTEVHSSVQVNGNVGWITSSVLINAPKLDGPFVGRSTEVWVRRDYGWQLAHGHWSEDAELASANR